MTIIATAPGKLVLLGEYAVLRGAPALVRAVEKVRARVELSPEQEDRTVGDTARLVFDCPEIGVRGGEVIVESGEVVSGSEAPSPVVAAAVAAAARYCPEHGGSLSDAHLKIDSSAFYRNGQKLGLGSSAAVTVALLRALLESAGLEEPSPDELFSLAKKAHCEAQGGSGSGVDVAASVWGGLIEYRIGIEPEPLELPAGVHWLPIWTGRSSSTPDLVRRVMRAVDQEVAARDAYTELTEAAEHGAAAARQGEPEVFLEAVRRFAKAYRRLGEASGVDLLGDVHRSITETAERCGAAYKPSGAGAGDLGIAFGSGEALDRLRKSSHKTLETLDLS